MRAPSKNLIYNVKDLNIEQYDELINYIQKYSDENKKGMDYLCAKEQRLEYKKNHYLHYNECAEVFAYLTKEQIKGSKPTANAKELFYTLENIQVDCRGLSEEQIDILVNVYESNKIPKTKGSYDRQDIKGRCNFIMKNYSGCHWFSDKDRELYTITYSKFMELFGNKEENFKKLVEVLNEELTEEYNKPEYEVTMIAEQPTHPSIAILDKAVELSNELKAYKETSNLERAEEIFNPQQHYSNELKQFRSLYELSHILKLNEWEFDILKRLVRCRKKNQFKEDLQKIKDTIDIYLNEFTDEK